MTDKGEDWRSHADFIQFMLAKHQLRGFSFCFVLFFWCEHITCSSYYQSHATVAGTYVTSFLILLMWKEKAPLFSPDLVITGLQTVFQSLNNLILFGFFHLVTAEQTLKLNFIP